MDLPFLDLLYILYDMSFKDAGQIEETRIPVNSGTPSAVQRIEEAISTRTAVIGRSTLLPQWSLKGQHYYYISHR